MIRRIFFSFTALLALTTININAATTQEMEQARAIAVKWCLRGMNNGSGYLNDEHPKDVASLEKALKTKEKENIGKLKGISMPPESEYAKWGKEEFKKYWTDTFFGSSAINFPDKNFCKNKAGAEIAKLNVTVQSAPTTPEQKPADENTAKQGEELSKEEVSEQLEETPVAEPLDAVEPEVVQPEVLDANDAPKEKSGNSGNTWSIIILIVLVIVVAALVVYAMNVMKKNRERQQASIDPKPESKNRNRQNIDDLIADKDAEIASLLTEIASLRKQLNEARRSAQEDNSRYAPRQVRSREPKEIFLAQADGSGVFLRADARFNMGNSIYRLVTTDGISGSYEVIDDDAVHELALMMPMDFLANACEGADLRMARNGDTIVNDRPGTAIFEDGRWRVSRKARIHYQR